MSVSAPQDHAAGRPLRVGMIVRCFYPVINGVVTQFSRYAPVFDRVGVALSVDTARTAKDLPVRDTHNGISIYRHDLEPEEGEDRFCADVAILRKAFSRWERENAPPDIVILFSMNRQLLPLLWKLRQRGIVFVVFLTNFPILPEGRWARARQWVGMALFSHFLEGIFVYSEALGQSYKALGVSSRKMSVVPFGVDGDTFRPPHDEAEKRALRERLGLPPEVPLVLFVGAIVERKGVDLLLEAWKRVAREMPSAVLVLVGPHGDRETFRTPEEREEHLAFAWRIDEALATLPNGDSVVMTGGVSNPEEYFRCADLFVFPSRAEGFGGVVHEAMASGLASLLTRYDGFPEKEFGREGEEYARIGFQPGEIAEALLFHLRDEGLRVRLGGNARRFVVREMTLEVIVPRMAKVLRALAEGRWLA